MVTRTNICTSFYLYNRVNALVYFLKNRVPVFVVHNALVHVVNNMQKKIGDHVGTTLDGGDAPILTIAF